MFHFGLGQHLWKLIEAETELKALKRNALELVDPKHR
jgi:hypothetical protein